MFNTAYIGLFDRSLLPMPLIHVELALRTFARNFSNIDFFLKILPLKDDELAMSEMQKKMGGHRLRFGKNMLRRTPKSE